MAQKELKVVFSGDTTVYRKEIDKAAVATKKLQKDAGSAMSDLAAVFGVNIGDIKGKVDGMAKTFTLLHTSMKASASGATIFEGAMKIVKIATIASGIGALVIVVGSLITYFTQTERGAESVERAMAGMGASFKVIIDRISALGESIINAFKNPKETITELWNFIKSQFVNRITAIPLLIESAWKIVKGIFKGGLGEAAKDFAGAAAQLSTGLDKAQQTKVFTYVKGVAKEMIDEGKAASDLMRRYQELEDAEKELGLVNTKRRADARDLFALSKEEDTTAENKVKLIRQAIALEAEAFNDEKIIAKEKLAIHKEQVALGEARDEQNYKTLELQGAINNLTRDAANTEMSYSKALKKATAEIKAKAEASEKAEKERRKQLISDAGGKPKEMFAKMDFKKQEYSGPPLADTSHHMESLAAKAKVIQDDLAKSTLDLSNTLNGAWASATEGFGEFLGNLLAGQGDISNFGVFIASAFADMAITVGKIAIATGITTEAIKKALNLKNPWVAIAAGVALIAVGTAVKSKLSSIASGSGATAAGSGTDGNGNYNYDARQSLGTPKMQTVNVVVSGEMKAKGNDLVYVFDQENQRKAIVT